MNLYMKEKEKCVFLYSGQFDSTIIQKVIERYDKKYIIEVNAEYTQESISPSSSLCSIKEYMNIKVKEKEITKK